MKWNLLQEGGRVTLRKSLEVTNAVASPLPGGQPQFLSPLKETEVICRPGPLPLGSLPWIAVPLKWSILGTAF